MKLKDLLQDQSNMRKELLIGREIDIQDKKALILGLREVEQLEDGELETIVKLMVLQEDSLEDEEDWEDEGDWEDEEQTNRQALIEMMDLDGFVSVTDIDAFLINGDRYETTEMAAGYLEEQPYEEISLIKYFVDKGCIPEDWLEKDVDTLAFVEYGVDPEMFNVNWTVDILNISAEMMEPMQEVLVGKVLKCACGHYEVPKVFSIKGRDGEEISVKLHGVALHNIWSDTACLDEDFGELEEMCGRDERLLVVEYSTEQDLQMEFYTKDYLDAPVDEEDQSSRISLIPAEDTGTNLCVIDVVPEDFDDEVEIELLSYTI